MLSKDDLSKTGVYPVFSSESTNNGIIGETNVNPEFIVDEKKPYYVTFGDHTRSFNVAKESFSVADNVKVLLPIKNMSLSSILFIISAWKKCVKSKGYARHWSIAKEVKFKLPCRNGKIDFDFMEKFIAELEAQRIAELEAYLSVTGLKDTHLSFEEEQALREYDNVVFEKNKATNIFDIYNTGNILSRDVSEGSGKTPYLCASANNNAISSYISYDEKYLNKGNCIFIGGKTFVVTYQEQDFFSNDSHNLALYVKEKEKQNKLTQLFLSTCVFKSLGQKYSWGNSVSKQKINKDVISLPKQEQFDHIKMENLISAIQKLVIKDVVAYADEKIEETKSINEK